MRREIQVHAQSRRIEIAYFGPVGYRERMDTMDLVCPQMRALGVRCVLLDFTEAWSSTPLGPPSALFVDRIASEPAMRATRLALVHAPPEQCIPVERAAPLAGFVARRFRDRDEAIAWMESDDPA